jgi:hypothetical protein
MEFVEAGDARVPINTLALLTLGAIRRTRGGIGGTGCSNPTNMERLAIQTSVLHWPVGRAWLMTHGLPWHGGAANYGFLASDRFRSRALVGGEMDRVTQRLHIDRVVLLVNAGHRMCCRRYGHDHRPAVITKALKPVIVAHRLGTFLGIRGTPERARFSPPGRPIQDRLQLITLPSSAHAAVRRMERSP